MQYLFCPETMGLYPGGLTGDAVGRPYIELSEAEYRELAGHALGLAVDGRPVLASQMLPTPEQLQASERAWRDGELAALAWLRDRHRDQLEVGVTTNLSADQFAELLVYMQALRDWPQSEQFPVIEHRPVAPPWIAEQHQ
ncbi:phage tail assembly chaperone [Pseudomonas sp. AL 58]|uniref:phage tail assembly chaperone n=1 Tax=Pseudomonas sp. AL 58 TaxID=3104275 RepID=UPI002E9DBA90|nr:phage tail assembly chaperone [Pseudomonas sp. AL 58]